MASDDDELKVEYDVIQRIKSGETKMRPRWYFLVEAILVGVGLVLVFVVILFVISFIVFALQENGGILAAHLGLEGFSTLISALPWSLLLLSLALVLILAILLRKYKFVYHQPFLYLLLVLIVVISLGVFFISASSLHAGIFRYALRNRLPVIEGFYQFEMTPSGNIYRGEVVSLFQDSFVLENGLGQTTTIVFGANVPVNLTNLQDGEFVVVLGHPVATGTIEASGFERAVMD